MNLEQILREDVRRKEFPVTAERIFLSHAGVAPLSRAAADAVREFSERGAKDDQEGNWAVEQIGAARRAAAQLLGCTTGEVALLGPTALGLNLVANGWPWQAGDEVIYYPDDYPANVYPWLQLAARGVRPVALRPEHPGEITWSLVEAALTPKTRLVALATCNFLSGYRISVDEIGACLQERGVLFCLDGIQTLGAFPFSVKYVDFLSADSHKWMLGPVGAGIFYVKASRQEMLRPSILGSWNVISPNFIAQEEIRFHTGARRYEPGTFNVPGIVGMGASLKLLLEVGIESIGRRILELRQYALESLLARGFREYGTAGRGPESAQSGILALTHPSLDLKKLGERLAGAGITVSLRQTRTGQPLIRISPHFYNTVEDLDHLSALSTP